MKADATIVALIMVFVLPAAAAEPFAFSDIRLGAGYNKLAQQLDFRDIEVVLREAREHGAAKPDLGRRGYGALERGARAPVAGNATAQARVKPAV